MWFLWEDGCFWVLTGPWSRLAGHLRRHPAVALVVDTCDLATGETLQVVAKGEAELVPFDAARGRRKLARYLGADEEAWDPRFRAYLHDDPGTKGTTWARLRPASLVAHDLSFRTPAG